ncbi:hypothetical protein [Halioxenophilus aromaticivorans]|uniref:Uncharacterized protein n=1 Tax=Halioxenophilus aromaticivorans TaxID=1306992 RepID=A0AAV3TXX9_9ALTE
MNYESLVYGFIIDECEGDADRIQTNRQAMLALPSVQEWPFLSQEMFSLPDDNTINFSQVVHFGASYKGIEYEWESWISHFEKLLQRMYWVSAKVHLDTVISGTHTFTWETDGAFHVPGSDDIRVQCEWSREGSL